MNYISHSKNALAIAVSLVALSGVQSIEEIIQNMPVISGTVNHL